MAIFYPSLLPYSVCFCIFLEFNYLVYGYLSILFFLPGDSLPGCGGEPRPARCRIMFANMNGLHGNLDELALAASHFDIVLC